MEGITAGRIVHYVLENGEHRAAIITAPQGLIAKEGGNCDGPEVQEPAEVDFAEVGSGVIALTVFGTPWDESPLGTVIGAPFDETGKTPLSWHWPERA